MYDGEPEIEMRCIDLIHPEATTKPHELRLVRVQTQAIRIEIMSRLPPIKPQTFCTADE